MKPGIRRALAVQQTVTTGLSRKYCKKTGCIFPFYKFFLNQKWVESLPQPALPPPHSKDSDVIMWNEKLNIINYLCKSVIITTLWGRLSKIYDNINSFALNTFIFVHVNALFVKRRWQQELNWVFISVWLRFAQFLHVHSSFFLFFPFNFFFFTMQSSSSLLSFNVFFSQKLISLAFELKQPLFNIDVKHVYSTSGGRLVWSWSHTYTVH